MQNSSVWRRITIMSLSLPLASVMGVGVVGAASGTFDNLTVNGTTLLYGDVSVSKGRVLDFGGYSKVYDDGNLRLTTDDFIYLNAPSNVIVQNDLQVAQRMILSNNGWDTGSALYDNGNLHVKTDDTLYLDASSVIASGGLTLANGLTVTAGTLSLPAGSVTSAMLADATLVAADLADGSVTSAIILDGTIVAADIAVGAVGTSEILDGTILAADFAAGAVDTAAILDGTVASADIAADTIDGVDLADTITLDAALALNGAAISTDNTMTAAGFYSGTFDTSAANGTLHLGETNALTIVLDVATTADSSLSVAGILNANGGIAVDTTNFTVSGTTGDVVTAGDLTINGGELNLTGVASSASTTEGTIYYDSDVDNLYVYANGAFVDLTAGDAASQTLNNAYDNSAGASTIDVDAGSLTWQSSGAYDMIWNLAGTGDFVVKDNGTDVFTISDTGNTTIASGTVALNNDVVTSDGDLAITGATGANLTATLNDLDLTSAAGSVILTAAEDAADSIQITSSAGGIDITATGEAGQDIDILNTGGSVNVTATEAAGNAIVLNASNAAGGIDIDAGTGTVDVLQTGAIAGNGIILATTDAGVAISAVGAANGDMTLTVGDDYVANVTGIWDNNVTGDATIDAAGVSIDGTAASNLTVTGAAADLTLSSVGGSVNVTASEADAAAIVLNASAGGVDITAATNDMDLVASTADVNVTGATNVDLVATAGDITNTAGDEFDATSTGLMDLNAGASLDIDVTGAYTMDSTTSFSIDGAGTASNVTLASDGAADNLTLSVTGATASSLILASSGTGADALTITTTAGGIDITAGGDGAGDDLDIVATGTATEIRIGGASTEADAIALQASAGGIDIDGAGAVGVNIDTLDAGAINIATSAAAASDTSNVNIGTSATARTITVGNAASTEAEVNGIVVDVNGGATGVTIDALDAGAINIGVSADAASDTSNVNIGTSATARTITVGNAASTEAEINGLLIDLNAGATGMTIDSADAISIDAAAASNFTTSAGDLTLQSTAGSVNVTAGEADAAAIVLNASAGGVDITAATNDLDLTASTADINATGATNIDLVATAGDITLTPGDDVLVNLAIGGITKIDSADTASDVVAITLESSVAVATQALAGVTYAANTTKFSVDTDGDTSIGGKVVLGRQTSAVNAGATNAVTATASYIEFTTAADNDDVVQLADGTEGQVVIMVNLSAGSVTIDQSATVMLKGGADVALTTNDTIMLIFDGTAWHEISEELTNG